MILNFPSEQQGKKAPSDDAPTNRPIEHTNRPIDHTIVPRGLSREQSARYIGISPSLFDQLVADGRMPQPRMLNARTVWDRWEIEAAFRTLPHRNDGDKTDNDDDDEWRTAV
jgi:predicted DNA-binding transcriptional regulator AlpA